MKIIASLHLIILICCISSGCNAQSPDHSVGLGSFTDSLFQAGLDSNYLAGGAVMVVQNDQVLIDKSYGYASLELSVPMPEHAQFEIGSVTKQFTAAAILKLLEQGKLSLDDDIKDYVTIDTKGRSITINQLLDHTSGIPSYTEIPEFWSLSIQNLERDTLLRIVEKNEFLFEPGEALIYNNSGYFLLGLVIEKASGKTYEEYLNETFFEPLNMKHSYYCSTSKVMTGKVYGYSYSNEGLIQKPYLDHTWPYAAGSLCSTTGDLMIWLQALHQGKVFDNKLYQSMITPGTLGDGTQVRYAKGLTNLSNRGNTMISHGGGIHGFLSETRYFPDSELYVICLINTTGPNGAQYLAEQITWQLLEKKDQKSEELDMDLDGITGIYGGQARGRKIEVEITTDGKHPLYSMVGQERTDTLSIYSGNNTWLKNNDIYVIENDQLRIDQGGGYYILNKQE